MLMPDMWQGRSAGPGGEASRPDDWCATAGRSDGRYGRPAPRLRPSPGRLVPRPGGKQRGVGGQRGGVHPAVHVAADRADGRQSSARPGCHHARRHAQPAPRPDKWDQRRGELAAAARRQPRHETGELRYAVYPLPPSLGDLCQRQCDNVTTAA